MNPTTTLPFKKIQSLKKFLLPIKKFITNLNTTIILSYVSGALSDMKWKQTMNLEMEALKKKGPKNLSPY